MVLPSDVHMVIERLESAGYEAWAVGGCVRDSLLGRMPKDYDVTSSCPPEAVCTLFPRCIETGLAYGTVTVLTESNPVEVTFYRQESDYSDNRHPENILPADSILADLSRRDFTINAMAWHPQRGLYDPFEGQSDLNQRLLRTVGKPLIRFHEDALRILRCLRFSSCLDFDVEEQTHDAVLQLSPTLKHISVERITAELRRLLIGSRPQLMASLINAGGLKHVGLHHMPQVDLMSKVPPTLALRLTALVWLCKTETSILSTLRFEKQIIESVSAFLQWMYRPLPSNSVELKRAFSSLPPCEWNSLLTLRRICNNEDVLDGHRLLCEVQGQPWHRSMLAISGKELQILGFHGTQIGTVLSALLENVIQHPEENTIENLLRLAHGYVRNSSSHNANNQPIAPFPQLVSENDPTRCNGESSDYYSPFGQ